MAKFIIKKKGEDDITVDAPSIEIGSRSTCAVWIDDPVVADRHCRIIGDGGKFFLSDTGTSTGTYLNAVAVKESEIPATAEIIIGVSRIQISINPETQECTVSYDEKKPFYFDRKVDPLAWSRSEVKFGRWKALRLANVAMLASLILVLLLSLVPPTSDAIMDPGPLLHDSIRKDRFHRDYHEMLSTLASSDQDCDACHSDFQGTPTLKCVACHQSTMENNHPRIANAAEWAVDCVYCHVEHRGTADGVLADQRKAESTCGLCHEDTKRPTADSKVKVTLKPTSYAYNTFSHADHAGKKLECMDCHKVADAPFQDAAGRWHEFSLSEFEDCMSCHSDGATHPRKAEKKFKATWHGGEEDPTKCTQCHTQVNQAEMRQVEFIPTARLFEYNSRSHQSDLERFANHPKEGCAECHKNGAELLGNAPMLGGIFEHGVHVKTVRPTDDAAKKSVSEECATCHKERLAVSHLRPLDNVHQHFTVGSCTECHDSKTGPGGLPFVVKETPAAAQMRNDFPHDKHMNVNGGCFACHVFLDDPDGKASFKALPITIPEAKSCISCHSDHANVAGGTCQECHKPAMDNVPADGVYWKDPAKWAKVDRPVGTGFSHMSRGHRDLVNPDLPKCEACHDPQKVWDAKSIAGTPIPDENDSRCTQCHISEKKRFHFMLSTPGPK